jgi:alpha-tubulin suppressor-like RCC1 family protein
MGLVPGKGNTSIKEPQRIILDDPHVKILKIVSGVSHLVMLGSDGGVYTCGCGEQGQLGRQKPLRKLRNSLQLSENGKNHFS